MVFNAQSLDTCSKLPANFVLFPVLSRGYVRAQLSHLYLLSTFGASHVKKIPGSPRLHNFNVRVPEHGSLGTRLCIQLDTVYENESTVAWEWDYSNMKKRGWDWKAVIMVHGMGMRQEDTGNSPPTPVPPAPQGPLCQSMQQNSEDQRAFELSPLPWQTWAPMRNDNVWKHWGAWYTMLQTLGLGTRLSR